MIIHKYISDCYQAVRFLHSYSEFDDIHFRNSPSIYLLIDELKTIDNTILLPNGRTHSSWYAFTVACPLSIIITPLQIALVSSLAWLQRSNTYRSPFAGHVPGPVPNVATERRLTSCIKLPSYRQTADDWPFKMVASEYNI